MTASTSTLTPASSHWSWKDCQCNKKIQRSYTWNQDQEYDGNFYRGSLHGEGVYKWKNLATYEGSFYSNHKEGYALMSFPDNSSFEGLFVGNQRFGPGIFTHSNGRQDVGFWRGEKLVRLSRVVNFIVPRLASTSAGKIKLLQFRRVISVDEDELGDPLDGMYFMCECPQTYLSCPYSSLIFDPRSCFFDKASFDRAYFLNCKYLSDDSNYTDSSELVKVDDYDTVEQQDEASMTTPVPSHCVCTDEEFVMNYEAQSLLEICKTEESRSDVEMGILSYFTKFGMLKGSENKSVENENPEEAVEPEEMCEKLNGMKILAWNRSEICVRMLRQIFRFRALEGKLTFNIAKLIIGARMAFRKTGKRENNCLEFLTACGMGPPNLVKEMLCDYEVSEELSDARGNNSVMFAAATDQHEIIDILADYGADINSFNDEGLTPLNLCLLRRLAHTCNLGNWETAFLPEEIPPIDEECGPEDWRKQISLSSLDKIFGDGTSLYEAADPQPGLFPETKESDRAKSSKSLSTYVSISTMNMPMLSTTFLSQHVVSSTRRSLFISSQDVKLYTETKFKIKPNAEKMEEFEKSIRPSSKGSYFFDLAPQKQSEVADEKEGSSIFFGGMRKEESAGEEPGEGGSLGGIFRTKTLEIDKTIVKLLKRGADPNIAEVPKPSLHLGVYAKSWKIVNLLLSYGANPNIRLYPNEGCLTPLHVLVLLKPSVEYVDICDLLLGFGADPEEETQPEFAFHEEEKPFLDMTEGRTPLQLLCMRPDLEYADPEGYWVKIALALAKVSDKTRLYNGYSYLALAMWFGNLKLLKALLDSKFFNPNVMLGNNMGTILHVLVSTEFQKKTILDTSIQICDLLLRAKANPLKQISYPPKLEGNCIDYGYREIAAEKALRISSEVDTKESEKKSKDKKNSKKISEKSEKPLVRDHLPDHVQVLEYLSKRIKETKRKKKRGYNNQEGTDLSEPETMIIAENDDIKTEQVVEVAHKKAVQERKKGLMKEDIKKGKKFTIVENENDDDLVNEEIEEEKNLTEEEVKSDDDLTKEEIKKENNLIKKENKKGKNVTKKGIKNENDLIDEEIINENDLVGEENKNEKNLVKEEIKNEKFLGKQKNIQGNQKLKKREHGNRKNNMKGRKNKVKSTNQNEPVRKKKVKKKKIELKGSSMKVKSKPCMSESFPEILRRSILNLVGTCTDFDVNELLLPYVVLRDGDLYYDFQDKGERGKEQYSLV